MISLAGKTALVTGGGQGIGLGCALILARAGADVAVNDLVHETGSEAAAAVRALGRRSLFLPGDVADPDAARGMAERFAAEFGALHVLVNNAGFNSFKGLADTSREEWDRILAVDLSGIYAMTRAMLPLLERAGSAAVVNIASVHASQTVANMAAYAAAKGAVVALTRGLCQELGPRGIRVNSVSPGFVDTPLLRHWMDSTGDSAATRARVVALHPGGRIGTPDDIGHIVAFLASDLATFITGANLVVDGGLTSRLMH
jgi:NAD(P)-dependent dehydrogenase (short-subunit alcohol dehydrogenase family)